MSTQTVYILNHVNSHSIHTQSCQLTQYTYTLISNHTVYILNHVKSHSIHTNACQIKSHITIHNHVKSVYIVWTHTHSNQVTQHTPTLVS